MRIYYTAEQIAAGVDRIAGKISAFYRDATDDAPVLAVCCLKGAAVFFADLIRRFDFPVEIDFIRVASYGNARVSSGDVKISKDVETPVAGRRVLVVDDLVDSGRSLAALRTLFLSRGAADVRLAVAFDKKANRAADVDVDFAALPTENVFLVGYGLDDAEKYRNLPELWFVD